MIRPQHVRDGDVAGRHRKEGQGCIRSPEPTNDKSAMVIAESPGVGLDRQDSEAPAGGERDTQIAAAAAGMLGQFGVRWTYIRQHRGDEVDTCKRYSAHALSVRVLCCPSRSR